MTTWVEGLEDTTVGDAGGRPIGFGIDKELKFPKEVWKPSPEKTTLFETQTVKIYYYCPDGAGTLESRTTTPTLVYTGYTAAAEAASQALSNYFPVSPRLRAAAVPESASNETVTTGARLPRPDAETRARAPPLTRRPLPRRRALLHLRPRHDHVHAGRVRPRRCSRPSRSPSS